MSTQGIDKHTINVHYYYFSYFSSSLFSSSSSSFSFSSSLSSSSSSCSWIGSMCVWPVIAVVASGTDREGEGRQAQV